MNGAAVAAGMALDQLVGEPPDAVHPVVLFGSVMDRAEARWWADSRWAGMRHAGIGVAIGAAGGLAVGAATRRAGMPGVGVAVATATCVAGRSLRSTALGVADALAQGDLELARARVRALVGRDVDQLDTVGVARAAIESVAENTVDAVVASALWGALGGGALVAAHRAVNTLDAMVGHRTARHGRFGWASARLDDAANWVPARLTALAVMVCRPSAASAVLRAVRDQAPAHPSPNAGVAEAAFAAALGVTLGGPTSYGGRQELRPVLGTGRSPDHRDIRAAVHLSGAVSVVVGGGLAAADAACRVGRRWRQRRRSMR